VERKIAELRKRLDEFYEASITSKGTTTQILNKLLEKVAGILHGKFILVEYRQGNEFVFKASYNLPEELRKMGREPIEGSICGHVLASREPLIIKDLPSIEPWCNYVPVHKYDLKTYFGVPLVSHDGKAIGTLCLLDNKDRDFSEEDIKVLVLFAQKASAEIEREELLNRVRESEQRYRSFFEHAGEGILVVDRKEGRLLEANQRFRGLSGYAREQLADMKIADLRPDEDAARFDAFVKGLFQGCEEFTDVPIRARSGLFYADVTASTLTLGGKEVLQCLVMDVTGKKEVLQQMINSERLASLGELSAAVAHEINNPMQTILAYSHLLLEDLQQDGKKKEWLQMMTSEASRVKKIVQSLLEFARRKEPEFANLNVNEIVESVMTLIGNQARTHNVQTKCDLGTGLPFVMGDASQLQQVFMNVAINAIEAMDESGTLTVTTRGVKEQFVEIAFLDTGCGVREEHIPRLFEPFFSTKKQGTGLGLSISHGIVASHGGDIQVKSELDKGTTVVITLPARKG
jgi:PAS domain S-box-containing protein